jgi:hypothetical protein
MNATNLRINKYIHPLLLNMKIEIKMYDDEMMRLLS